MPKYLLKLHFLISFLLPFSLRADWNVSSPNGKISATIQLNDGVPSYFVQYIDNDNVDLVVKPSKLGVARPDIEFNYAMDFYSEESRSINESYSMLVGKKKSLQNQANEITLTFIKFGKLLEITFRAYDDGIAFRYRFPETSGDTFTLTNEVTAFNISTNGKAWLQAYATTPYYEISYGENNIGQNSPTETGWCFPALFHPDNYWILFTEANIDEHFYVSHLNQYSPNGNYTLSPPLQNDLLNAPNTASSVLPWTMPWRVLIIGKELKTITESNMVAHLATPSKIADTSWIKSGVAAWSWWSNLGSPRIFSIQKQYVDFAHTEGLPYVLIDGTWDTMEGGTIQDVIHYADSLGVKIWNWYDAGGLCDILGNSNCDLMRTATLRRQEFAKISAWGVVGIKIDFFQSDKQQVMKQYMDILNDAAEYHLMVNFHGCTFPQGWQRTYPNLLAMEAVRGAEMLLFVDNFRYNSAAHNVDLVFTRNVVGSMDYTPGILSTDRIFHNTTSAHELALLNIFESGITHMADRAESYLALPTIAQQIIGKLPTAWDETHLLEGYPEDYAIMARRKDKSWYVSGINGKSIARNVNLAMNFLQSGDYTQRIIKDGGNERQLEVSESLFQVGNSVNVDMLPYGGFLMVFEVKCPTELSLTAPELSGEDTQKAYQITATNQIKNGANVKYSAKNFVLLNKGFTVEQGSVFRADLNGCEN